MRKLLFLILFLFLLILNANCLDYYSTRIKGLGRGLAMIVDDDLTKLGYNPAYINETSNQLNLGYTSLNENGFGNTFKIQEYNGYKIGLFAEYSHEKDSAPLQEVGLHNYELYKDSQFSEVDKYRHLGDLYNFKLIAGKGNSAIQYQFLYEDGNNSPRKYFYEKYSQTNYQPDYFQYDQLESEKNYDWHKTEQTHKITIAKINEPIWKFQSYSFEVWYNHQDVDNKTRKIRKRERFDNYKDVLITDTNNQYSSNGIGLGFRFNNRTEKKSWLVQHFAAYFLVQMSKTSDYTYNKKELNNEFSYNSSTGYIKDKFSYEEEDYNRMSERWHEGKFYLGYSIEPLDNMVLALGISPYFEGYVQILQNTESSDEANRDELVGGIFIPLGWEVGVFKWLTVRGGISYRVLDDRYYEKEVREGYEYTGGVTLTFDNLDISASLSSELEEEIPIIQSQLSYRF